MMLASKDDFEIALSVYNNSNYEDKNLLNRLMAKALVFENRRKFTKAVSYTFTVDDMNSKKIYAFLAPNQVNKIYMDIFNKIKNNE